MNENELQKDVFYWCEYLRDWVKYCGTQRYEGKVYHNFFRAGIGLFYWLDPQDVNLPNNRLHSDVGDSPAQQALFTPEADTAEGKLPAPAPRR